MTKKIYITCDTEIGEIGFDLNNCIDLFIWGKIKSEEIGIKKINQLASAFNAKVHHFIDIYPAFNNKQFDNEFIKILTCISTGGHSIGLHTHPTSIDKTRRYMYQYNLDEQKEIIYRGKEKIYKMLGQEVYTHRAGGYGANLDTVLALSECGIVLDSSYYPGHPHCHLPALEPNAIHRYDNGVVQVGISTYINGLNRVQKLDYRYGSTVNKIIEFIEKAPDHSHIVLFMHSFNFLDILYNKKINKIKKVEANLKLVESFSELLSKISKLENVVFSDLKDYKYEEEQTFSISLKLSFEEVNELVKNKINSVIKNEIKI